MPTHRIQVMADRARPEVLISSVIQTMRRQMASSLLLTMILFTPAPAQDTPTVQALLDAAAWHLHLGEPDAALAALETVEATEPDNPWLWFYRGAALVHQGKYRPALDAFDRAARILTQLGDPDPELARRVRGERARARRELLSFNLTLGTRFDSNVAYLGDAPTVGQVSGRSDYGLSLGMGADALLYADPAWRVTGGLHFRQLYQCDVRAFNEDHLGLYLSAEHRLDDQWTAAFRYDYDFVRLGHESFLFEHALSVGISHDRPVTAARLEPGQSAVYYRLRHADYLFSTPAVFARDGLAHTAGLAQSFRLRPVADWDWTWDVRLGYEITEFDTQGREFDRLAHTLSLGISLPLIRPGNPGEFLLLPDRELRLRSDISWHLDNYRNPSRFDRFRNRRHDEITSVTLMLSQTLIDDAHRGRLVLHAIGAFQRADSNVEMRNAQTPFTYEKYLVGLQLQWSF